MIPWLQRQWTNLSMGARVIIGMIAFLVGMILLIELAVPTVVSGATAVSEFGWLRILAIIVAVIGLGVRTFRPDYRPFVFGIPSAIAALYLIVSLVPGWESWPTYYPAAFWGTIIALLTAGITLSYAITWESSTGRKILRALHIATAITFVIGVAGGLIPFQSRYEWTVAALRKEAAKKRVEPVEEQLKKCRAQIKNAATPAEADQILNGCETIARHAEELNTQYGFGPPTSPLMRIFAKVPPDPVLHAEAAIAHTGEPILLQLSCSPKKALGVVKGFEIPPKASATIYPEGGYREVWRAISEKDIEARRKAGIEYREQLKTGELPYLEEVEFRFRGSPDPKHLQVFKPEERAVGEKVLINTVDQPQFFTVTTKCVRWRNNDLLILAVRITGPA